MHTLIFALNINHELLFLRKIYQRYLWSNMKPRWLEFRTLTRACQLVVFIPNNSPLCGLTLTLSYSFDQQLSEYVLLCHVYTPLLQSWLLIPSPHQYVSTPLATHCDPGPGQQRLHGVTVSSEESKHWTTKTNIGRLLVPQNKVKIFKECPKNSQISA